MMKPIKLFFIFVLAVSSTLCFAYTADEEEAELKSAIFTPIVVHFSKENGANSSISERLSAAIIKIEVDNKTQFTRDNIVKLIKNGAFSDIANDEQSVKCMDRIKKAGDVDDPTADFVIRHSDVWSLKMATCRAYAKLVLIAYEFSYLININKNLDLTSYPFKDARIISTKKPYDHSIVLVEGRSGAMFAIDPWAKKLIRLDLLDPAFVKLSAMKDSNISNDDNKTLNAIYSKPYYYAYYVAADTEWEVDHANSDRIVTLVFECNAHMRDFYNTLQKSFPLWTVGYPKLFPGCVLK